MPLDHDLPQLHITVFRGHRNSKSFSLMGYYKEGLTEIDEENNEVFVPYDIFQYNDTFALVLSRLERWLHNSRIELNTRYDDHNHEWRSYYSVLIQLSDPQRVCLDEIRAVAARFVPIDQIKVVDVIVKGDPAEELSQSGREEYDNFYIEKLYV